MNIKRLLLAVVIIVVCGAYYMKETKPINVATANPKLTRPPDNATTDIPVPSDWHVEDRKVATAAPSLPEPKFPEGIK